jgi:3-oxoacyl-[acyl-carrier-protein] synthase II
VRWLSAVEHAAIGCDIERTRLAGAPVVRPTESPIEDMSSGISWMSQRAAHEALEDADLQLRDFDRRRCGIVLGTSKGSLAACEEQWKSNVGSIEPAPPWLHCWPNFPATQLAQTHDVRGPVLAPIAACATGLLSICRGVELIRDGQCDVVLAGSVDDSLREILWASYRRLGVLAKLKDCDPGAACRPFDRDRNGFLMGAGAAVIVLERLDQATARGHQPYAEWLAGGMLSDACALTQVSQDAAGLTRLIQETLRRGAVSPAEVDYINLHGTGTRENDRYETQGIRQAMGNAASSIPCSSLKGTIGHLLGGAGSVEFAAMLLAMRDGIIPPTANLTNADPQCDLNYTPRVAHTHAIGTALKLSLGFGGHLVAGLVRNCRA